MAIESAEPVLLPEPSLATCNDTALQRMLVAAREIHECHRVLHRAERNIVTEILQDHADHPQTWSHYPENDVRDRESGALYYYHSHREGREHGHFHCFVQVEHPENGNRVPVHIGAISMDAHGMPVALFATNRWVTDEYWLPADETIGLLDRFVVDHAAPSWPVNRWISAMPILFRPHFETLLRHRDRRLRSWADEGTMPPGACLDDERLEVTGLIPIDLAGWLGQLQTRMETHS